MIDQKLNEIKDSLAELQDFVKDHNSEHKLISKELAIHGTAISILAFVAGLIVAGIVKILFFGG